MSKLPKTFCPNCNNYLGDIHNGTPYCTKCKTHIIIKQGKDVKRVAKDFYNGTELKEVV